MMPERNEVKMPQCEFKMRADTPRVVRSPILEDDGTSYFIPGTQFEDGRSRLIVGVILSADLQADIIRALDEADQAQRTREAVVAVADFIGADVEIRSAAAVKQEGAEIDG